MKAAMLDLFREIAIACLATVVAVTTRWLFNRLNVPGGWRT